MVGKTPTRTRNLSTPQSRTGCYTCKQRKVKCDEGRPYCRRCVRARRSCEGYANSTPVPADTALTATTSRTNLAERCLRALDTCESHDPTQAVLREVLSSVPSFLPSTADALQALEMLHVLRTSPHIAREDAKKRSATVDEFYGAAVQKLSAEISDEAGKGNMKTALFITAVLLLALDLLQQRRLDGLMHGLGALSISTLHSDVDRDVKAIQMMCKKYDLQCLFYSEGLRRPVYPVEDRICALPDNTADMLELKSCTVNLLHSVRSFIADVHHSAISNNAAVASKHTEETCIIHLERLMTLRTMLNERLRSETPQSQDRPFLLTLTNLVIATTLQLQQLYATNETSWDAYIDEFHSIIQNIEEIYAVEAQGQATSRKDQFSLRLGVIPPLQLVATKCRYAALRRKAITLLRDSGCEGPFFGVQIAAMAVRCMIIEGQDPTPLSRNENAHDLQDSSECASSPRSELPEEHLRIARAALISRHESHAASRSSGDSGRVRIRFLRRKKPGDDVAAALTISSALREMRSVEERPVLDETSWECWTEEVDFKP